MADSARDISRRSMLARCGMGLGSLGLATLLADEARAAAYANPLAPRGPQFRPRAKRWCTFF